MNTLPPRQTRRRFPLKPKSVRTPPARYTLMPATEATWKTETMRLTKCLTSGYVTISSDDCWRLTGGREGSIKHRETKATSFSQVLAFVANACNPTFHPQFHEQIGDDTATISLRYQVPAQPARKEPCRLSKKLKQH